jgi:uncharacterized repeat protein (TIGR03803 family)
MKILRIPLVIILGLAGWAFNAGAQTETNLHSFAGPPNDGAEPNGAGLVQGSDGNFYGTSYWGGTYSNGTVFRISPSGTYTTLHSFAFASVYPFDGSQPAAGLVQGSDGNFYGTTPLGGAYQGGTIFRISPSGAYTSLYSFVGAPNGGEQPYAGLVQGNDGNFYGTTLQGGTSTNGNIFRISPSGTYSNLYSFVGSPTDGSWPRAGLVEDTNGNFYGTTQLGGTNINNNCPGGCGIVFRISPSGSYSNLHSFFGYPTDGQWPDAGLVQGSDGNFYGTTQNGGTNGAGTVFRISPSGTYTTLYSFGPFPDGAAPEAGLVQGSDGNFYGTTTSWGTNYDGTVFRISPSGSYTSLYSFVGSPTDGKNPQAGLVQGSDGSFYGTTLGGGLTNYSPNSGLYGYGIVFKLTVPLDPPANQISQIQLAGTNIVVNIPSVAYETYQLQYRNSMTLGTWSNVSGVSVTNSIGALLMLTNFGGASLPQGFYRFDITP